MTRRSFFFLTPDDLLAWLAAVEHQTPLAYTLIGSFFEPIQAFRSSKDIEGFGTSRSGDCAREPQYLLLPSPAQFMTRTLVTPSGRKQLVYPDTNPGSVVLTPAGIVDG